MIFADPYILPEIDGYLQVDCGDFRIRGRSVAGVETVLCVPELNITFDTGRAPSFACGQDWLALTHCHPDHAGALAFYLGTRCLNDLKPLQIVVPEGKRHDLENYLAHFKKLSESQLSYVVRGNSTPVKIKRDAVLRALPVSHCVTGCGYLVDRIKKKLKKEFKGASSEMIVNAKLRGESIDEEIHDPWLAVSGDTTGTFLEGEGARAQVLLMECTFFAENMDFDKIRLYGHTHIQDWRRHAEKIQSRTVVMTHISQRYTRSDIESFCQKNLPKSLLDRLVVFR